MNWTDYLSVDVGMTFAPLQIVYFCLGYIILRNLINVSITLMGIGKETDESWAAREHLETIGNWGTEASGAISGENRDFNKHPLKLDGTDGNNFVNEVVAAYKVQNMSREQMRQIVGDEFVDDADLPDDGEKAYNEMIADMEKAKADPSYQWMYARGDQQYGTKVELYRYNKDLHRKNIALFIGGLVIYYLLFQLFKMIHVWIGIAEFCSK